MKEAEVLLEKIKESFSDYEIQELNNSASEIKDIFLQKKRNRQGVC